MSTLEKQAMIEAQKELGHTFGKYQIYIKRVGDGLIFESQFMDEVKQKKLQNILDSAFGKIVKIVKDKNGTIKASLQGYDSVVLSNLGDKRMPQGENSFGWSALDEHLDTQLKMMTQQDFIDQFGAVKAVAEVASAMIEKNQRGKDKIELK